MSFSLGVVSIRVAFFAAALLFPDITLKRLCKLFAGPIEPGGAAICCNFGKAQLPMYQNVTEGKFMFSDKKFSPPSDKYYLKPRLDQ